MVCIDTSIFISVYRQPKSKVATRMAELSDSNQIYICGQVWIELVGGFRNAERRRFVSERLRDYHWLETARNAYELAAEWVSTFRGIGPGDAVIAATAYLNECDLFTLDQSFNGLQKAGLKILAMN